MKPAMAGLLKRIGTVLLFVAIAICFAPTIVPAFLDRIYYRGPVSDHYDGERFHNPDDGLGEQPARGSRSFLTRSLGNERAQWPEHVAIRPTVPPPRVRGRKMLVTWVGHATVLVQTEGLNILTDPIWSSRASPFSFIGPERVREPGIRFDDLPKIDLVLVSHNHYDHLDLPTLERLWRRDRPAIVTSLGNDAILKSRGIPSIPLDWRGRARIDGAAEVIVNRNHHWSSRWFVDRNRALWSAFTIRLPGGSIFFAGDTGWGDGSWVDEAAGLGPFRFAIIPIGAYEPRDFMKRHHIDPAEAAVIFQKLQPAMALGVHWGTFQLTFEPIDDPPRRLQVLKERGRIPPSFVTTEVGRSFWVPSAG